MKNILSNAFTAIVIVLSLSVNAAMASTGADDLIRMARSGVDEEVLSAYIESSPDAYDLDADDIITLKDLGVPSKIINEALRHGHENESDSMSETKARETIKTATDDDDSEVMTSAAVAPPPGDLNISFFYEALNPYGNWLEIDGEWCWQPNAMTISPDWKPYFRNGHWVDSDWGWCWVSDYSWGWAPFHYGRWLHHHKHGWCWVPDTEWGPAWVSWRRGGAYCGWAPLPPHTRYDRRDGFYFGASRAGADFEFNLTLNDYFFVPTRYFCDPHPWAHMVPPVRHEEVFRRTSFLRDSYRFEHDHIFNRGVPVEEISRAWNKPIRPITIMHDDLKPGEGIHRGMIRGNRLMIFKPQIAPAAPQNPAVIKSFFERRAANMPQRNHDADKMIQNRRKDAAKRTIDHQRLRARNAEQEKIHLEKAAHYEEDSKKQAEFNAEAEIQNMRARNAQDHVTNIKRWDPPAERKSPVMPRSRVVPQPSPDNSREVQTQVRDQVKRETQVEQRHEQELKEVVRKSPPAQPQNEAGQPQSGDRGRRTRN